MNNAALQKITSALLAGDLEEIKTICANHDDFQIHQLTYTEWTLEIGSTSYLLESKHDVATIKQRSDAQTDAISVFIVADDLAVHYPGINAHLLLVDEPEMTTRDKLAMMVESLIVPLEWYLPQHRTNRYFTQVLNSEHAPFGAIFKEKDGSIIRRDDLAYRPINTIYVTPEDGATIVPEIERWLDMGGETFFRD